MCWLLNNDAKCPKCGNEYGKCRTQFRGSCLESFYLVCTNCGLRLYAGYRVWKIDHSYIDRSIIGKNLDEVDALEFDEEKDVEVITGFL